MRPAGRRGAPRAIHQLLAEFREADATGNHALTLQRLFCSWGFASDIFAAGEGGVRERASRDLASFRDTIGKDDVVVYHHTIQSDAADAFLATRARRVMVYHNITPSEWFEGVSPVHERLTRAGRAALPHLVRGSECILADSAFNAEELRALGAANCHVLPILIDFGRFRTIPPDEETLRRYRDGRVNVLFVGRMVRNKKQIDLVEAFRRYARLNAHARLLLVGSCVDDPAYTREVADRIQQGGLGTTATITGAVTDAQLIACYRSAHVFLCLSEHEGFCVPIVEAMYHDVPVMAYAAAAVPETLAGAGVLLQEKDHGVIAAELDRLVRDTGLREQIVNDQRQRLKDFEPETVARTLRLHLAGVLGETEERQ